MCCIISCLIFLVTNFCIIFCIKDSRLKGQHTVSWVKLAVPGADIYVILTILQALCIYPLAGQALICAYFWYPATDFNTLWISFNCFHNNRLGFQCVQPPKRMWTLLFKCHQQWKSFAALGEMGDILMVFSNYVCRNTATKPKFWVLNFLDVSLLTARFLKWPQVFWKICGPQA